MKQQHITDVYFEEEFTWFAAAGATLVKNTKVFQHWARPESPIYALRFTDCAFLAGENMP